MILIVFGRHSQSLWVCQLAIVQPILVSSSTTLVVIRVRKNSRLHISGVSYECARPTIFPSIFSKAISSPNVLSLSVLYSRFIHHSELRISPLRKICKNEYTKPVAPFWTDAVTKAFDEMRMAVILDPCLQRFDYRKPVILWTDFSARGFGYVLLQSGNDDASIQASQDYQDGKGFTFMTKDSKAVLHPICFGAQKCHSNKVRLHSHLGECFAGN